MKKLILILILVAGLVTAGSFQVGRVIESELPAVLNRVAELGQMQISMTSYERNLFRSNARTTITMASISGTLEEIHLHHRIWHGPFPFGKSRDGKLHFKPMSALVETTVDNNKPPGGLIGEVFATCPELYDSIEMTSFDFAGNGTSNFSIPGFTRSFGSGSDELTIEWDGMTGVAGIDKSLKKIKGETNIPSFKVFSEDGRFETENIRSTYKIFEELGGLLLGNVTLDAAAATLSSGRTRTELSGLQFRNAAELSDDTVSYSIAIGIDKMTRPEGTYGPIGFELDFSGLDAMTILDVQKQLQTIQGDVKSFSEDEIAMQVFSIYAEALPELIKRNPEIRLNYLNMKSPDGDFWSKGEIQFENRTGGKINNMQDLLSTVRASIDSQVSKTLLHNLLSANIRGELIPAREAGQLGDVTDETFEAMISDAATEQLTLLTRNGSLVDEGKTYRATLAYENRVATLNGRPFGMAQPQ